MSTFVPSSQQSDIFTHLRAAQENLIVAAVAGSGKTTTLVEGLRCLPVRNSNSLLPPATTFLAFNKSIAETLAARCPRHVACSTFHSLGFRALKSVLPNPRTVKVEGRKVVKLVYALCGRDNPDINAIIKLVSLAKGTSELCSEDLFRELALRFDVGLVDDRDAFRIAEKALARSNNDLTTVDFDDMLYLPVLLGAQFERQDYVLVDEAQDTNDIQLEILTRLQRPAATENEKTLFVFVGDPHQAIYGFRGANTDSMSRIAKRFACRELPLSVSYRCPKAIVREAQKYMKETTN